MSSDFLIVLKESIGNSTRINQQENVCLKWSNFTDHITKDVIWKYAL